MTNNSSRRRRQALPPLVRVVSFGHLYGPAPTAHVVVDLREGFHNPDRDLPVDVVYPDPRVISQVLSTAGVQDLVDALALAVESLARVQDQVVVAVGCAGGHHRAPTVTSLLADQISRRGHRVSVSHRDLHTPVG